MNSNEANNEIKHIQDIIQQLGLATDSQIKGCSPDEIRRIEQSVDQLLPIMYVEFLRAMGKGAGQFMYGTEVFYPSILRLKKESNELLQENPQASRMAENAFVFAMHGGGRMYFFLLDGNENPTVYHYWEGEIEIQMESPTFSDFLKKRLKQDAQSLNIAK